jgi:hypothetical protein
MQRTGAACGRTLWLLAATMALGIAPAAANPLMLPTVHYTQDVEITRPSDFAVRFPARHVYGGQRIRVDYGTLSTLINFDRRETTIMMPRVRTYWWPQKMPDPLADGRRWIGVEAESAEVVGPDTILGIPVTRYRVKGRIFDTRTPFEGDVWTTRENIVVQVDGIGREDGVPAPVTLKTIQLVVAPPDPALLAVPSSFARARKSDESWRDGD